VVAEANPVTVTCSVVPEGEGFGVPVKREALAKFVAVIGEIE
jgi:hypothetical protein